MDQDSPYKNRLIANAKEITERSHPNSFSKGTINTPDDDLTIPATIIEKNAIINIIQL
jgi:hypothetical protein